MIMCLDLIDQKFKLFGSEETVFILIMVQYRVVFPHHRYLARTYVIK